MTRTLSALTFMAMALPVLQLGCATMGRSEPAVGAPSQAGADALILVRGIT